MVGQLGLGIIILVVRFLTIKNKLGEIAPIGQNMQDPQEEQVRRGPSVCSKFVQAQPFAILFATFFFIYLKLPQFSALFWFT